MRLSIFCVEKMEGHVSVTNSIITMTTRNINNLREYLTTPFNAFLQIDEHPALPITLTADSNSWQPLVQTHGKDFNSVEHLFHHYNKYNAGSKLNRQLYLKDDCQRLLQYIIFQEGPYSRLSVAQTLELSPAEWADMPELMEIDAKTAPAAKNTVTHAIIAPVPQVSYTDPRADIRTARRKRMDDFHSRCSAIERNLQELHKKSIETTSQMDRIFDAVDNINATIGTLQNVLKTIHSINNIRTRLA